MKQYKVEIVEKNTVLVDIEAEDRNKALKKAKQLYEECNIPYEYMDYSYEINIVE